jgi:hypothetical protein
VIFHDVFFFNNKSKDRNSPLIVFLHGWKEDYTRQSQPPARGVPLG